MTPEEAMKVLADYKMESSFAATPKFEAALGLGIEALKEVVADRISGILPSDHLLPGETEE